jgi:hypothetical protein
VVTFAGVTAGAALAAVGTATASPARTAAAVAVAARLRKGELSDTVVSARSVPARSGCPGLYVEVSRRARWN